MNVGIFYNSISTPAKYPNKVMLMDNFRAGVLANGDKVTEFKGKSLSTRKLDVGFVLGYTLEDNFRKQIINTLRSYNTPQVFVDSNILHYARPEHEWHRYSLNSVYPNDGVYLFDDLDRTKWETFSKWHNVTMKPWRNKGNHILLLGQRPAGWNMFGNNQHDWITNTIDNIRKVSNRPIVIRMHPGDKHKNLEIAKLKKQYHDTITISNATNIREDLNYCWCTVGYNSTPNVVSAIEGIPGYIEDPLHSWAKDVAFTDMQHLIEPLCPDREDWIHKIANIHWSNAEVKSGKLWAAIRHYISSSL